MQIDCEECGEKDLEQVRQDGCRCHISPPCSACTDAPFVCRKCGEHSDYEQPEPPKQTFKPYVTPPRKTLDDLDRTKIDWMHTGKGGRTFHDVHGYSPDGTSRDDILKHLRIESRPCMPRFKTFSPGGYFHLSYFID